MDIPDDIKSEFPVEIDLGMDSPAVAGPAGSGKATPKKSYPSLYIGAVEGLDQLPQEGYALIYFKRKRVTIAVNDQNETDHSADLEIQELCLPDKSAAAVEDDGDMMDAAKSVAKKMGVDTGEAAEPAAEEATETEEE